MSKKKKKKRRGSAESKSATYEQTKLSRISSQLIEISWIVVFVLIPFWFNPQSQQMFELDKAMMFRMIVQIMLGCYVVKYFEERRLPHLPLHSKAFWAAIGFFGILVLSTALSKVPFTSFWGSYFRSQGLLTHMHYLCFFLILVTECRGANKAKRLLYSMIFGSLPVVLIGLLQRLGHEPMVWLAHRLGASDSSVWINMSFGSRIFSTFGQPNFLGGYLAMIIPISLGMALISKKTWIKIGLVSIALLQLVAVYLTTSRGAAIGAMAGILLFGCGWAWSQRKRIGAKSIIIPLSGGILIAVFVLLLFTDNPWQGQLKQLTRLDNATYKSRLLYWEGAWEGIKERPILGWGPESMFTTFSKFYDPQIADIDGLNSTTDRAHNDLFDTGYTTGLLGLGVYLSMFVLIGLQGLRLIDDPKKGDFSKAVSIIVLASLGGFWAQGMFSFSITMLYILMWTVVMLGINSELFEEIPDVESKKTNKPRKLPDFRIQYVLVYAGVGLVLAFSNYLMNMQPVHAEELFREVQRAQQSGDFITSTDLLRRAHEAFAPQSQYSYHLANDLIYLAGSPQSDQEFQAELLEEARQVLDELESREWQGAFFYSLRGRLYLQSWRMSGDPLELESAYDSFEEASNRAPAKAAIYNEWGEAYWEAGEYEIALARFEQAAQLFTNKDNQSYHDLQTDVGKALYALGRYEESVLLLRSVFRPGSFGLDSFEARYYLSAGHYYLQQYDRALNQAQRALELNDGVNIHSLLMEVYLELGDQSNAQKEAQVVLQLEPDNQRALQVSPSM